MSIDRDKASEELENALNRIHTLALGVVGRSNPDQNYIMAGGIYWRASEILQLIDPYLDAVEGLEHAKLIRESHGLSEKLISIEEPSMTKRDKERLEKFTLAAMQGLAARNTLSTYLVGEIAVQIAKQTIKEIDKQSSD